jgi:hypothetical protein
VGNTSWLSKEGSSVEVGLPIKKHIYSLAQIMYENLRHSFKSKILEVTALSMNNYDFISLLVYVDFTN